MLSQLYKLAVVVGTVSLVACGGGGGGSGGGGRDVAPERPAASLSGVAFDGLIIGGDVKVYDFTSANKGALLGTGKTNGQGLYSVSLSTSNKPVLIEIDGGYYLEEASGVQVQVDKTRGRKMLAVEFYESGKPITISATFFSTIATGLVEYLVKSQGLSTEVAIEHAYAEVDGWAGFDTRRTTPLDVSAVESATPFLTDGHRYGFLAAAISQLSREVGAANGDGVHDVYTSIGLIQEAYKDVRVDGLIDGLGQDGRINYGNIAISGNTYRDFLAMRMLQFVRSSRNQTGLTFDEVLPFASQINTYSGELFGNTVAPDITESQPVITQLTPGNGITMQGTYPVSVIANDPYGIASIHVYVGDRFVVAASLIDGRAQIDTLNFTNGNYVLRVDVTNFMGNAVSLSRNVMINNGQLSMMVPGEQYYRGAAGTPCPARFTLSDTTGTGVNFVKYGEAVLLYKSSLPNGVVSLQTSSGVSGNSCRGVTAEDGLGNPYSFALATLQDRSKCVEVTSGRLPVCKTYEYRCRWSVSETC